MSGIVGIVNLDGAPLDLALLERMTSSLAYRGPDGQHTWTRGPAGLGQTLLRTTFESETECQACTLDGQVWLTADARVDGRADLMAKMADHGVMGLEGVPDSLLILHAFRIWGDECVQHLLGDFAFAIWDAVSQRLFCARDHFGVKPFFYARVGNSLVFSNTLDCVRLHPLVSNKLNDLSVADFLLFGTNLESDTTTFADIQRLPPGHVLSCASGALAVKRFWTLEEQPEIRYQRKADYVEHFNELMDMAVADRLRTDKACLFQSGGLDSAAIAAAAVRLRASRFPALSLQAHTAIFQHFIPDREREFADLVVSALGIPIEYLVADDLAPFAWLDGSEAPLPEPDDELQAAVDVHLLRRMSRHCPVALNGDGGDEGLALPIGPPYWSFLLRSFRVGQFVRDATRYVLDHGRLPPVGFRYWARRLPGIRKTQPSAFPRWLNPQLVSQFQLAGRWDKIYKRASPRPGITRGVREDARWGLTSPWARAMFTGSDASRTNCPVEIRYPFFDVRLVEFLLAIPPMPWCVHKEMLRAALRGQVPEAICCRPKTPLAGDPLLEFWRLKGAPPFGLPAPVPELARYISLEALATPNPSGDTDEFRLNSRPRKLNAWLRAKSTV